MLQQCKDWIVTLTIFLVKTIIKQKLIGIQVKTIKQTKWNQSNLQDPAMLK